ncbi:hypothetical protein [Amycolatopsis coloradensis]|uniref:hypothetical protein n=1 Tax=Amycolatopsis coloradensis TaxID=76021 RepID=UPI001178AA45|nr:hypothetical protein [Amycolatopsis coloradensis]
MGTTSDELVFGALRRDVLEAAIVTNCNDTIEGRKACLTESNPQRQWGDLNLTSTCMGGDPHLRIERVDPDLGGRGEESERLPRCAPAPKSPDRKTCEHRHPLRPLHADHLLHAKTLLA